MLLRTVGPGRDRFDLSLSVAETLLASSSSSALATPILIALRPDLEQQNLDHWEPALALRAYRAMLQVARQAPCPGLQPPEELLNRLLRLGGLGALTGTRL